MTHMCIFTHINIEYIQIYIYLFFFQSRLYSFYFDTNPSTSFLEFILWNIWIYLYKKNQGTREKNSRQFFVMFPISGRVSAILSMEQHVLFKQGAKPTPGRGCLVMQFTIVFARLTWCPGGLACFYQTRATTGWRILENGQHLRILLNKIDFYL